MLGPQARVLAVHPEGQGSAKGQAGGAVPELGARDGHHRERAGAQGGHVAQHGQLQPAAVRHTADRYAYGGERGPVLSAVSLRAQAAGRELVQALAAGAAAARGAAAWPEHHDLAHGAGHLAG